MSFVLEIELGLAHGSCFRLGMCVVIVAVLEAHEVKEKGKNFMHWKSIFF